MKLDLWQSTICISRFRESRSQRSSCEVVEPEKRWYARRTWRRSIATKRLGWLWRCTSGLLEKRSQPLVITCAITTFEHHKRRAYVNKERSPSYFTSNYQGFASTLGSATAYRAWRSWSIEKLPFLEIRFYRVPCPIYFSIISVKLSVQVRCCIAPTCWLVERWLST